MTIPPKQFHAGSDVLRVITPALEARLQEINEGVAVFFGKHDF